MDQYGNTQSTYAQSLVTNRRNSEAKSMERKVTQLIALK